MKIKKHWPAIYVGLLVSISFIAGLNTGRNPELVPPMHALSAKAGIPCETDKCKHDADFTLQSNGYSGWQMGCLYTKGSNADWDEKTRKYGDQKYLDCANGLVYEVIGESSSNTYFNPDDKATNEKYCSGGKVADFNVDNPLTPEDEAGTFNGCITW